MDNTHGGVDDAFAAQAGHAVMTLVVAVLLTVAISPTPAVATPATVDADTCQSTLQQSEAHGPWAAFAQDIDADAVVLAADIRADGDADWRVTYRLTLDTEEREAAFEELRRDIRNDTSAYLGPFEARMTNTSAAASEATGRAMSVRAFSVETERESQPQAAFGLVTFRFEWVGFAAVEGDTIRAGDGVDRLILGDGESLQFGWPADYSRQSSSPAPDTVEDERVVWRGPVDFDAGQPRVELTAQQGGDRTLAILALVAVGVALAVAAVVWRRRAGEDEQSGDAGDGAVATADADTGEAGETGSEADTGDADSADEADIDDAGSETDGERRPPPELLSNEERVLRLLEQNGGRMKQGAVAEQLDWTAAKTSQVVSDLREAEAVESFRLGRENVLTLPDVDIMDSATDGSDGSDEQNE